MKAFGSLVFAASVVALARAPLPAPNAELQADEGASITGREIRRR